MADMNLVTGGMSSPRTSPAYRSAPVDAGISVDKGAPVTTVIFSPAKTVFSKADSATTANCMGLAVTAGEAPGRVDYQPNGPLTLSTEQWDNITGETGGLTPHSVYYVSTTTAGKLTKTRPVSGFVTPVGFALDETTMMVQVVPTTPLA